MATFLEVVSLILRVIWSYFEALWDCVKPKRRRDISGQVAVVTGSGRGIGKEIAKKLIKLGAKVAVWDINEKDAKEAAADLVALGGTAHAYAVDVTSSSSVKAAADQTRHDLGSPTILVNNAGIVYTKDILSLTEKEIRRTYDVNVISQYLTVQEFFPVMLAQNDGHIVATASITAQMPVPYLTDYCASKSAVVQFIAALAEETRLIFKKPGIRFTTVMPGFVDTKMAEGQAERYNLKLGVTEKRMLTPEELAEAVVNGIVYNKLYVYCPSRLNSLEIAKALMPRKTLQLILDFADMGLSAKEHKQ